MFRSARCTIRRGRWLVLLLGLTAIPVAAQLPHRADVDTVWCDSTLHDALVHGLVDGHFRLFAMGTANRSDLSDHYAAAFGGALGYRSARWHGLRFSLMGGYTLPLFASELKHADDPDLMPSRYELGLFDASGHHQREYVYLHELNVDLRTRDRRWQFTFGKQHLDQPFLNGQDSRMHPTLFDGLTVHHRPSARSRYEAMWIHHVAPRSTSHWYPTGHSIGAYPGQGRDVDGRPSGYAGQLTTAGLFTVLAEWELTPRFTLMLHDLVVEGIFNTAFVQIGHRSEGPWRVHLCAIRQDAMGDGGHAVDSLAYLPRGASSNTLTGRMEYVGKSWTLRLNATRITANGRLLMPREWGREPLFTFLSRERNEGLGDVWAASANAMYAHPRIKGLLTETGAGLYRLSSPREVRLNKYQMVSYGHVVFDVRYAFHGVFDGLDLRLLYVFKWPLEREALTDAQVYNRVDMHHGSLVVDYHF